MYQAVFPYWAKESKAAKKSIFTSSIAGSLGAGVPMSTYGYGLSKVGVNFFAGEIASEHSSLYTSNEGIKNSITAAIHPGAISTDLAAAFIEEHKITFLTPQEAGEAIISLVDKLKPIDNGTFEDYDGTEHPWQASSRVIFLHERLSYIVISV